MKKTSYKVRKKARKAKKAKKKEKQNKQKSRMIKKKSLCFLFCVCVCVFEVVEPGFCFVSLSGFLDFHRFFFKDFHRFS